MTPSLAKSQRADASLRRAAQLAALGQGLPVDESIRPWARQQALDNRQGRVAGMWVFSIAFHRLNEVPANPDRSVGNEGAYAYKNALEVIGNAYSGYKLEFHW